MSTWAASAAQARIKAAQKTEQPKTRTPHWGAISKWASPIHAPGAEIRKVAAAKTYDPGLMLYWLCCSVMEFSASIGYDRI